MISKLTNLTPFSAPVPVATVAPVAPVAPVAGEARIFASPMARTLAARKGIDLSVSKF